VYRDQRGRKVRLGLLGLEARVLWAQPDLLGQRGRQGPPGLPARLVLLGPQVRPGLLGQQVQQELLGQQV
jgi:hypothetical protein